MPKFDATGYDDEAIKQCQSYVIGENCEDCQVDETDCRYYLDEISEER